MKNIIIIVLLNTILAVNGWAQARCEQLMVMPDRVVGINKLAIAPDGQRMLMAGRFGFVGTSNDSGTNWTTNLSLQDVSDFKDILFFDQNEALMIRESRRLGVNDIASNALMRTLDGGKTWHYEASKWQFKTFFLPKGQILYANTNDKKVVISTDRGRSWQVNPTLINVKFADSLIGIAETETGMVRTTDGGSTWTTIPNPSTLYTALDNSEIGVSLDRKIFWCLSSSELFLSKDNGNSFYKAEIVGISGATIVVQDERNLDILFGDGRQASRINGNSILRWSHWDSTSLTQTTIPQVIFTTDRVGYLYNTASNSANTLFKTTDGGRTWVRKWGMKRNLITSLKMLNDKVGFCINSGNEIAKTTDGGITWNTVFQRSTNAFFNLFVYNEENLMAQSGANILTLKVGRSWQTLNTPFTANQVPNMPFPVVGYYSPAYWHITRSGTHHVTRDSGRTYQVVPPPPTYPVLDGVLVCGVDTVFVVGRTGVNSVLYYTKNGGTTWEQRISTTEKLGKIRFSDKMNGFLAASTGFYTTTDGGQRWQFRPVNLRDKEGQVLNPVNAYIHDTSHLIYFNPWGGTTTDGFKYTKNGGQSWATLQNPEPQLPASVVEPTLKFIPDFYFASPDSILASGDFGLSWLITARQIPISNRLILGDTLVYKGPSRLSKYEFRIHSYIEKIIWSIPPDVGRVTQLSNIGNEVQIQWAKAGRFPLTATVKYRHCEAATASTTMWVTVSDTLDLAFFNGFKLYPNPTKRGFWLEPREEIPVRIRLYDLYGFLVHEQSILANLRFQPLFVEPKDVLNGFYIVEMNFLNGKKLFQKVLFQN